MKFARTIFMGFVLLGLRHWVYAWTPPIGVPTPAFNIELQAPALPSPWDATLNGWYWICPTCAGATDTGNPNGYPGRPRTSIPTLLPAGSIVVLGGQIDSVQSFAAQGTASQPIIVRGVYTLPRPLITQGMSVTGSYVLLDYLHWGPQGAADQDFGLGLVEGSDHIILRNSEFSGNANRAGGLGLGTWMYGGAQSLSQVVVFNSNFHHIGDLAPAGDVDKHCITVNGSVDYLWVVDNEISYCGGDAMQIEANSGRRDRIHHVYYGRNHAHHNRQSGGWIKNASDVIFSQNVMHDHVPSTGGPGACTGQQYGPEYTWFLYNEMYNCPVGLAFFGGNPPDGLYSFAIGNRIHDTSASAGVNTYNQGGIVAYGGGNNLYLFNNTLDRVASGIHIMPGIPQVALINNIISNRTQSGSFNFDIYVENDAQVSTMSNNLFFNSSNLRFSWETTLLNSLSALQTVSGKCQECVQEDPFYVNVSTRDYRLSRGSPAINTGSSTFDSALTAFQVRYGINIAVDTQLVTRPFGGAHDIGAFEFSNQAPGSDCDVNSDLSTNVIDVQSCVNQAMGVLPCNTADVNNDNQCTVIDVQRVVNAALGGPCITQ